MGGFQRSDLAFIVPSQKVICLLMEMFLRILIVASWRPVLSDSHSSSLVPSPNTPPFPVKWSLWPIALACPSLLEIYPLLPRYRVLLLSLLISISQSLSCQVFLGILPPLGP